MTATDSAPSTGAPASPRDTGRAAPRPVDVLVIGAGQAGLSAAYHLQRRRFAPIDRTAAGDERTFVVLDADVAPGGAWRHRWASLRMETVNGIHALPGYPVPPADAAAPAREVLPHYFGAYEERFALAVRRPVHVRAVRRADDDPHGRLLVETDRGDWAARFVINATGTWRRPFRPASPGVERFRGRHVHVHDYVSAEEFAGQRVIIVGGGVSATQLLDEISHVADTFWVTRREPVWTHDFSERARIAAIAGAEQRAAAGLPTQSIVQVTGMIWAPWVQRAHDRGVLVRHPMFTAIEPEGVRMPDGSFEPADAILWATGFRAELGHLAPLKLRTRAGGLRVVRGRSVDEPRLFVIGYGPSQSTVGANRAGRDAVRALVDDLSSLSIIPHQGGLAARAPV